MPELLLTLARRSSLAGWKHSLLVGLGQMFLMAVNIRNIAQGHLLFLAAFTVVNTYVWVYIVRTVMHSQRSEVFAYAIGSSLGAVAGVLASHFLIEAHALSQLGLWGF